MTELCPQCYTPLERVKQSQPCMLNREQFDSVKAGDWVCNTCPDNGRGKSGLCYWWDREIKQESNNE